MQFVDNLSQGYGTASRKLSFPLITALHAVELYSHVFAAAQCLCEFPKMPYFTYINGSIFGKRYLLAIDHIMSTYYFIFGT